ncbi:TRAP transporter substrate-binding protein [Nostoc sp.]|uniref:TRAP transporter substrate-binding protein n=1 Tax=Nostoc sp. TaxID=1180 RepID=UPI002FFCE85A
MDTFLSESAKNTILYDAPQAVCDRVKEMSGERFIITLKRSGKTEKLLNDVNEGVVECGYNGIYYSTKKLKILYFGCAIPFGLNPQEQNAWLYYKKDQDQGLEAQTFMQSIYSRLNLNIVAFPAGATGGQAGGWSREPVNSINDFKNKTMRIPGFEAEVIQKFGARTHDQLIESISIDKLIRRLKDGGNGRFDAVEWTGPHDDLILVLDKAVKFYYFPGWWEPNTTFEVQVNKKAWEHLSPEYREIFKAACSEVHMSTLAQYVSLNSKALKELKEKIPETGIQLMQFNDDILKAARDETIKLLD